MWSLCIGVASLMWLGKSRYWMPVIGSHYINTSSNFKINGLQVTQFLETLFFLSKAHFVIFIGRHPLFCQGLEVFFLMLVFHSICYAYLIR